MKMVFLDEKSFKSERFKIFQLEDNFLYEDEFEDNIKNLDEFKDGSSITFKKNLFINEHKNRIISIYNFFFLNPSLI